MFKFNNDHILTGYIKQLLASVNLPQRINGQWALIDKPDYYDNKFVANYTRKFQIKNNIYDSYTHNYLGDYLRFLRDYKHINLMPLYNCFSNEMPERLNLAIKDEDAVVDTFDSSDPTCKIYMVPVKSNTTYTIAIENPATTAMCFGFYGKYQNTNDSAKLQTTWRRESGKTFDEQFLITSPDLTNIGLDLNSKENLISREKDLKLFIKLPATNSSSIAVLEGDYTGCSAGFIVQNKNSIGFKECDNHYVTNYEQFTADFRAEHEPAEFKPLCTLRLLSLNTGISYPFSDALIAYLLDNNITPIDTISDNIERLQAVLSEEYLTAIDSNNKTKIIQNPIGDKGLWEDWYTRRLYDYAYENYHAVDNLGFVDKKLETQLTFENINLKTVDIYPELYRDSKKKED